MSQEWLPGAPPLWPQHPSCPWQGLHDIANTTAIQVGPTRPQAAVSNMPVKSICLSLRCTHTCTGTITCHYTLYRHIHEFAVAVLSGPELGLVLPLIHPVLPGIHIPFFANTPVRTSSAPKARSSTRRSSDMEAGMVSTSLYPWVRQQRNMAKYHHSALQACAWL